MGRGEDGMSKAASSKKAREVSNPSTHPTIKLRGNNYSGCGCEGGRGCHTPGPVNQRLFLKCCTFDACGCVKPFLRSTTQPIISNPALMPLYCRSPPVIYSHPTRISAHWRHQWRINQTRPPTDPTLVHARPDRTLANQADSLLTWSLV